MKSKCCMTVSSCVKHCTVLWISYESTESCRNHSLSTHLGARTSTMSCSSWYDSRAEYCPGTQRGTVLVEHSVFWGVYSWEDIFSGRFWSSTSCAMCKTTYDVRLCWRWCSSYFHTSRCVWRFLWTVTSQLNRILGAVVHLAGLSVSG